MSLAPTSRGMRLIRQTRSVAITMPQPTGGTAPLLVTDTGDLIVTESGNPLSMETA